MPKKQSEDETLAFKEIFYAAFRNAGSMPAPEDWSTCYSILEVRKTSLMLAAQYQREGKRLQVKKLEERAKECEQVFSDLAAYLAEGK